MAKNRQNSFWYKNAGDIAKFTKGDREIIVSPCGDTRVKLSKNDCCRKNEQDVDVAFELNLTDKDLNKLDFSACNWFDFVYKNSQNLEESDGNEEFTYTKALKLAEKYLNDNEFWKQFN
jgi:hypothetical protein